MQKDLIVVACGVIGQIAREHGIARQTVSKALKGDTSVLKCDLIRTIALQRGGVRYKQIPKTN